MELFDRRNFVCDCGTTRLPKTSPCSLREDTQTGTKGVHSQEPASTNTYNQNFKNRFCACAEWYDPAKQKGTMFQCLGLATESDGGCGEDWWHPECLIGLPRDWHKKDDAHKDAQQASKTEPGNDDPELAPPEHPVPPGFPDEEAFDRLICYKCVEKVPWLKRYAHAAGFIGLPRKGSETAAAVIYGKQETTTRPKELMPIPTIPEDDAVSRKRSHDDADSQGDDNGAPASKKSKVQNDVAANLPSLASMHVAPEAPGPSCKISHLPPGPEGIISILGPEDFRDKFCRCREDYLKLREYPMLLDEEEIYEPPISEDGDGANGGGSAGTGSLLDRGEAALSNVDRVRAIEGVMVYNHLKSKVKDFLKPFAENGQMVSAEDIKAYFEKLRGDAEAIKEAKSAAAEDGDDAGDGRREQSGY